MTPHPDKLPARILIVSIILVAALVTYLAHSLGAFA